MAISFPDTVSAAIDFSGGSVRAQGASKSQSHSETEIDECGVCSARESLDEADDFNAVLGWMMSGVGPQVQPVLVADKSRTTSTETLSETDSSEAAMSLTVGPGLTQVGMAPLTAMSYGNTSSIPSGSAQSSAAISKPANSQIPVTGRNIEPLATIGVGADNSSDVDLLLQRNKSPDEVAASAQFPSNAVTTSSELVQGFDVQSMERLFSSQAASGVSAGAEVHTTTIDTTFAIPSDSLGLTEALSQDAIDALERIGLPPGVMLVESSESVMSGISQTTSVLPTVAADGLSESTIENSKPLVLIPSIHSKSRLHDTSTPVVVQSTGDLIASSKKLSASSDSGQPAATAQELLVSDSKLSVMDALSESNTTEIQSPSVAAASAPELKLNSGSVMSQLDGSIESQDVESIRRPVRLRPLPGASPFAGDKSGFPPARESRTTVGSSLDVISGDVSPLGIGQLSAANSFSNFTATVSSEVRQPLSSQVSHAILAHLEHSGVRSNDSLSVRLDPPELGEMRIELSKTLEGLAVRVTASEAVTMDMLLARGQEIESQLRGQQLNLKSLEFLQPGMSGNSFSQGQQNAESRTSEKLMNQVRRGSQSSGPANPVVGRVVTSDSAYGLSFRA